MSRPFPTTFDKDGQSQSGGNTPISYQANVNRQKTKKWVDAKAPNYGGDDWGSDDDEYGYDEPSPPLPVSKSTGYRQQGHNVQSPQQSNSPAGDAYKKSYGDLPSRPRANSFDADDETRNFSSTSHVPSSSQTDQEGPATRFSEITGIPSTRQPSGPPLSVQTQAGQVAPIAEQRQPSQNFSPAASVVPGQQSSSGYVPPPAAESKLPSGDYQAKRDYSPSAAPPPLNTLASSPSKDLPSANRFPARKSSLSQVSGPNFQERGNGQPQDAQPTQTMASPSAPAPKALPFIRPADIYRRAEEERRQSVESNNRPDVERIMASRSGEAPSSPSRRVSNEISSPEPFAGQGAQSMGRDESPGPRQAAPILEPVKERRSEYGFDGFSVSDQVAKDTSHAQPQFSHPPSESVTADLEDARVKSTSPQLPNLNRMSGFGVDMFFAPPNPSAQQAIPEQQDKFAAPTTNPVLNDRAGLDNQTGSDTETASRAFESGPGIEQSSNNSTSTHGKDSSTVHHSLEDDEPLQPPRALMHAPSAQSFRPDLPGGWTSYSTIPQVETPQPEPTTHWSSIGSERIESEDKYDLTPTTTKHTLPQTQSTADVNDFQTGAARGEHDTEKTLPPPPQPKFTTDSMPTPDPSMAPSGNLYAATTIDPRLLPKLEQAPAETQLRPDIRESNQRRESSELPPPPPAKDTPEIVTSVEQEGYFPSNAQSPTSPKSADTYADDRQPPMIDQQTESVSDENDRLEEEIVRRLSPQPREEPRDGLLTPTSPQNARESTYLPSEYGDYWAAGPQDAQTPPSRQDTNVQTREEPRVAPSTIRRVESDGEMVAPLSVAKSEKHSDIPAEAERPTVQQRFSWEQSTESVSNANVMRDGAEDLPPPASTAENSSFQAPPPAALGSTQEAYDAAPTPQYELLPPPPQADEKIASKPDSTSINRGSFESSRDENNTAAVAGATALAAAVATAAVVSHNNDNVPQRRASLAEEKATRVSSYPVTVTPPENEHPARSPEPYFGTGADHVQQQPPPATSTVNSPSIPPPPNTTSRLLAFKEIMNMNSSHQRIQTFDETRHRFAAMDSGLSNWMETLKAQHPEHNNATGLWSVGPGVPAKHTKSPGLQQPYYQQYLNASSPTATSTSNASPAPVSAQYQQQGPSKITTQQVQAKGKELLHTAGIFGGKAGKAGKGLLAKGKSRFGRTGGDKVSPERPSPEPRSKNESRKSWSLPLSRPKSIGVSEKSQNASRDNLSAPTVQDDTKIASPMTSVSTQPPILPRTATSGTFDSIDLPGAWPATPAPATSTAQNGSQSELVASVREIHDADQSTTESDIQEDLERRDTLDDDLAPPRPIGKHQPSWDPFNATPIAEEQGSAYDTRPDQRAYPFPTAVGGRAEHQSHPVGLAAEDASKSNSVRGAGAHDNLGSERRDESSDDLTPGQSSGVGVIGTDRTPSPGDLRARQLSNLSTGNRYSDPQSTSGQKTQHSTPSPVYDAVDHTGPKASAVAVEQEEKQDSSFLPPVRRTSVFSFKFGSRRTKERFPIDDDDEDDDGRHVVVGTDARAKEDGTNVTSPDSQEVNNAHHTPLRHERRSLQQLRLEDSGYSTDKPSRDLQGQNEQSYIPTRMLDADEPTTARKQSVDGHEPLYQTGSRRQSSDTARPPLIQTGSSQYSQQSLGSQGSGPKTPLARSHDGQQQPVISRTSQDAWRPNVVSTGVSSPPPQDVPAPAFMPRQSWEGQNQRPRGASGSGANIASRPDIANSERQWSPAPGRPFEQPPSAAQRYPNLFKSAVQNQEPMDRENADLPAHYYQQPLPREAAFLPRQQTNEYQLPGVGPDEYRKRPRRNSSLLRDIGGRISRATSRERRQSISQDDDLRNGRSRRDSRIVDDDADSSIMSDEVAEKKKRRSSFFRGLSRSSTGISDTQRSNDNVTPSQFSRSQVDQRNGPAESSPLANPTTPNPLENRNFSGISAASDKKHKQNKLSRSSAGSTPEPTTTKKKRFSGLSGFFGSKATNRNATPDRPQATRELPQGQRQPLETPYGSRSTSVNQAPQFRDGDRDQNVSAVQSNRFREDQNHSPRPNDQFTSSQSHADRLGPSQRESQRSFSQPVAQDSKPRKASRTRRSSGAGLFSGLLGRKQSHQDDSVREGAMRDNDQQSYNSPARSQSDFVGPAVHSQGQNQSQSSVEDRGRPVAREPQYDNVPIPGGYSVVRAQAGQPAPTNYHPRASGRDQSGPRYSQEYQTQSPSNRQHPFNNFHGQSSPRDTPNISVQTQNLDREQRPSQYQSPSTRTPRPLSPDDIAARSPALTPRGQQRPYQLSLPDEQSTRTPTSPHSDVASSHFSAILAQQARQASSPANYPLPQETPFSPVVSGVNDVPPPPPPKDGNRQEHAQAQTHARHPSNPSYLSSGAGGSSDLNRSGTHRTAVSALSGLSDPSSTQGVRRESLDRDRAVNITPLPRGVHATPNISGNPSTEPPSPVGSMSRVASPALSSTGRSGAGGDGVRGGDIKTTTLSTPRRTSEDLYDASPLAAPPAIPPQSHKRTSSKPETPRLSIQTQPQSQFQPQPQQGSSNQRYAELEGTKADGFNMRIPSSSSRVGGQRMEQEEKIFYDAESGLRGGMYGREEEEGVSMSATSYPGQEWNPYGTGGWDDDSEVGVGVGSEVGSGGGGYGMRR